MEHILKLENKDAQAKWLIRLETTKSKPVEGKFKATKYIEKPTKYPVLRNQQQQVPL